jgi:hypothetical protein
VNSYCFNDHKAKKAAAGAMMASQNSIFNAVETAVFFALDKFFTANPGVEAVKSLSDLPK